MYDISYINILPVGDYTPLIGAYFAIIAEGGYAIKQAFSAITLSTIRRYDVTEAVQVRLNKNLFNTKLGAWGGSKFTNDSIIITAAEFLLEMKQEKVISVGTYSTLYSDFIQYVNYYFGFAGAQTTVFSPVSAFDYNNGVFDASAFMKIITATAPDASGGKIDYLTGSITIHEVNKLLQYAVEQNVFGNRPTNSGYDLSGGFVAGDLIFIPKGTTVTLSLDVLPDSISESYDFGVANVNQLTNTSFTQKYGSTNFTEQSSAVNTLITRTLTAPLLIELSDI